MTRYVSAVDASYDRWILSFEDEYSEWCDYLLNNSDQSTVEIYPTNIVDLIDDEDISVYDFPRGYAFTLLYLRCSGRMLTMIETLNKGRDPLLPKCIEGGLDPKQTYKIKQLISKLNDQKNYEVAEILLSDVPIDKLLELTTLEVHKKHPDLFELMVLFNINTDSPIWGDLNTFISLADQYDQYQSFFTEAGHNRIPIEKIATYADELDILYNTWTDGVPIADVFA